MISNTGAAVSAYAEAITDGIQDRLRLHLFESIWSQGRNMSSAYDVRRVVAALLWPTDPISRHLYRQLGREPGPPASSCPGNSVTPAGQPGPHLAGQDSRSACKVRHARVAT